MNKELQFLVYRSTDEDVFKEGELSELVVVSKMERTTMHGGIPEKTDGTRRQS